MKRIAGILALALMACAFLPGGRTLADSLSSGIALGVVGASAGASEVKRSGAEGWGPLRNGDTIGGFETVRTNENNKVEIRLEDGRVVFLDEFSSVAFKPVQGGDEAPGSVQFDVLEGSARFSQAPGKAGTSSPYIVNTLSAKITAEPSEQAPHFIVEFVDTPNTSVTVLAGKVKVESLKGGYTGTLEEAQVANVNGKSGKITVSPVSYEIAQELVKNINVPGLPVPSFTFPQVPPEQAGLAEPPAGTPRTPSPPRIVTAPSPPGYSSVAVLPEEEEPIDPWIDEPTPEPEVVLPAGPGGSISVTLPGIGTIPLPPGIGTIGPGGTIIPIIGPPPPGQTLPDPGTQPFTPDVMKDMVKRELLDEQIQGLENKIKGLQAKRDIYEASLSGCGSSNSNYCNYLRRKWSEVNALIGDAKTTRDSRSSEKKDIEDKLRDAGAIPHLRKTINRALRDELAKKGKITKKQYLNSLKKAAVEEKDPKRRAQLEKKVKETERKRAEDLRQRRDQNKKRADDLRRRKDAEKKRLSDLRKRHQVATKEKRTQELRKLRAEAENKKRTELKRKQELERKQQAEMKRKQKLERKRQAELKRKEQQRQAEMRHRQQQQQAEIKRKQELERKRQSELKRKEQRRQAELRRKEQQRQGELRRKEQQRQAEIKRKEQRRQADMRRKQDSERKRHAALKRKEQQRQADIRRRQQQAEMKRREQQSRSGVMRKQPKPTREAGTPRPTRRPAQVERPKHTVRPTHTVRPSNTGRPTNTIRPANTARPSYNQRPSYTPRPSYAPRPNLRMIGR